MKEIRMPVGHVVRFSGGEPEQMVALAKRAKAVWIKNGAETARLMRVHTGPWMGQWLFFVRCSDWASYGKAQESIQNDAEFKKVFSETLAIAKLEARNITMAYDI
jgi:hypothetical protein